MANKVMFGCTRIHLNPHVLRCIGGEKLTNMRNIIDRDKDDIKYLSPLELNTKKIVVEIIVHSTKGCGLRDIALVLGGRMGLKKYLAASYAL
jgi:hypothetical protein